MQKPFKAFLNWSSGKDAAYAFYMLNKKEAHSIEALLTTVNSQFNRVSMHGTRIALLEQQAKALNLPLFQISLNGNVNMQDYNEAITNACLNLKAKGYTHSVFGDIFLEDLKAYREEQLSKVAVKASFPLWKKDTKTLATQIINSGIKAIVICTSNKALDASFCGRLYDEQFIKDLPKDVDPCGENGEFHTFVYDAPFFKQEVAFSKGETIIKSYTPSSSKDDCHKNDVSWDTSFTYLDLLPI